jgi:hypothetical protein
VAEENGWLGGGSQYIELWTVLRTAAEEVGRSVEG